jgi:hypothetical protein
MSDAQDNTAFRFGAQFWQTLVCAVVAFVHFCNSGWKADWVLVVLMGLVFLPWAGPWLSESYKSIGSKTKLRKNKQGVAPMVASPVVPPETLASSPAAKNETVPAAIVETAKATDHFDAVVVRGLPPFDSLPMEEKQVLASLWKHQVRNFPQFDKTWTFLIGSSQPAYPQYIFGVFGLVVKKLAVLFRESGQVGLSAEGIVYCRQHKSAVEGWTDTYDKFANAL